MSGLVSAIVIAQGSVLKAMVMTAAGLKTRGFEPAPLLLGFVLTPPIRDNLNRAILFANGDITTFVTHPLSAVLFATAGAALLVTALPALRRRRALLV